MREKTRQALIARLRAGDTEGFIRLAFKRGLADGVVHGKRDCYTLAASLRRGKGKF